MQIQSNANLRDYHTFGIDQSCSHLVEVSSIQDIIDVYRHPKWQSKPKLMLGKGSNMLFTQPFDGVVIVNRLLGKTVSESDENWHLHIAGGEDWPSLVQWSVEEGYFGLENLAMIPGCAGSAPIQNIGAYGLELKEVCDYVDVLDLQSYETQRLTADECQFGYRDSIFKHDLYQKVIVIAIGLRLPKCWQAKNHYGPLKALGASATAQAIFDEVCEVRSQKLPNPDITGNAGSFFKNPVITQAQFKVLSERFPDVVAYPAGNDMKVAAGWLIDQCGLKGYQMGGAQVHPNQALVLVNSQHASAMDVVTLAAYVREQVLQRYDIELEHEVRFIGRQAETNLNAIIHEGLLSDDLLSGGVQSDSSFSDSSFSDKKSNPSLTEGDA
ncbi:UDP-N-acetylmuramate dehydrogenase [Vibrio sp.]|nr:UDP-N-acetylmuramate dehydrogenase [Vibrio sp.]